MATAGENNVIAAAMAEKGIGVRQWSEDWYREVSADELDEHLRQARISFEYSSRMGQDAASLMWRFRIMRMEKELAQRSEVAV